MRKVMVVMVALLLAGCTGKEQVGGGAGAPAVLGDARGPVTDGGSESRTGPDDLTDPSDGPRTVAPSPATGSEIALPAGSEVIEVAGSAYGPEVFALVQDSAGRGQVLSWTAGSDRTRTLYTLPEGFRGRSIVELPARKALVVAGALGDSSQLLRLTQEGNGWKGTTIYVTRRLIERVVASPRPFASTNGPRYRLLFAARSADSAVSLRTVTEGGRLEYQIIGPERTVDDYVGEDSTVPERMFATFAFPMAMHPNGHLLYWRDAGGCAHRRPYGYENWGMDSLLGGIPCQGEIRVTPNGRDLLQWRPNTPGVDLIRSDGMSGGGPQATGFTFLAAPVSVPDGRGVIGAVSKGNRVALVYAPIAVPLADVANAWDLGGNACDEQLFTRNAGLFRETEVLMWPEADQLFTTYERLNYEWASRNIPDIATTDLFWENFGTAYNGVFIVLERRRAVPAFRAFVEATDAELSKGDRTTTWAKAFAALGSYYRGETTGEAGLIASGSGVQPSSVLDSVFDFNELKPRGHYTSDSTMVQYFRAVHYLTSINQVRDPAALASLPATIQQKARQWIDAYGPFIAPSRAPLVWSWASSGIPASYAKHPWEKSALFPLSWGLDNEALESAVYHRLWPADEQIRDKNDERRLHASGLDVGVVYGSRLARTLLADTMSRYPRLGPVLTGIAGRRPASNDRSSIYQRWLDAAALEWADSMPFPGTAPGQSLWDAKRLQTGLATWATLREATILVTERPSAAEMGEGGFFEPIVEEPAYPYVEPSPRTFDAIAGLYDALRTAVAGSDALGGAGDERSEWHDGSLQEGISKRLMESAAEARQFAVMARKELRGEPLTKEENEAVLQVGGAAEHQFLIYKSLANSDLALSVPEPMSKIADVQGDTRLGVLEVAVGRPLEWHQIVPYFGRRQIAVGAVYSYHEFIADRLYDNTMWRAEVARHPHPAWVQGYVAPAADSCRRPSTR